MVQNNNGNFLSFKFLSFAFLLAFLLDSDLLSNGYKLFSVKFHHLDDARYYIWTF